MLERKRKRVMMWGGGSGAYNSTCGQLCRNQSTVDESEFITTHRKPDRHHATLHSLLDPCCLPIISLLLSSIPVNGPFQPQPLSSD